MKRYWQSAVFVLYGVIVGWLAFPENWWQWGVGLLLAILLTGLDRILYVWWLKPYEQLSLQVQYWWKRKDFMAVAKLFMERGNEQTRLIFKSMGFALIWPLLTLYMITSTGSMIATGLVMGLGLMLVLAILADWPNWRTLKQWFWWQIKRDIAEKELRVIVGGFVVIWLCLSLVVTVR